MSRPLLVMFMGFPGSGKTYFASRLGKRLGAVVLNSDALRLSMFGSAERIEQIRGSDNKRLYDDVFGAMNYATRQTLLAGVSVVYDAQQAKRSDRARLERLAQECGTNSVLVWMQTDPELAKERGQSRSPRDDSHVYSAEKMEYLVNRFSSTNDMPETSENFIEISGEVPFEQQFAVFKDRIDELDVLVDI